MTKLTGVQWTTYLAILLLVIIAGAVGGGVKGHKYIEDHHDTQQSTTQTSTSGRSTSTSVA